MSIYNQLKQKKLEIFKTKDKSEAQKVMLSLINVSLSEAERNTKSADRSVSDLDMLSVLRKSVFAANETQNLQPTEAGALELQLATELLESLQPKQLDAEELKVLSARFSSIGEYMKYLKSNHAGQYDGKFAQIVFNEREDA